MSWSDRAVSPVVYAPVAGEMTLEKTAVAQHVIDRLLISGGKLSQTALNNFIPVRVANVYKHSAGANYGSEHIAIFRTAAGSWLYAFAYGILRSTDNRATWTLVRSGNNRGPFTQLASGRIIGWSCYSDNDGATWVTYNLGQGLYSGAPRRSAITGTLIGGCNRDTLKFSLIRSTNDGTSWAYVYVTDSVANNYYDPYYVVCLSTGTWLCGTQFGGLYRSTDDGVTWVYKAAGSLSAVNAIHELPDGRILAIGGYRMSVSADDGATWTEAKYDTTVFRGCTFSKFAGNFGLLGGCISGNPTMTWTRLVDLTTWAITIPGSVALFGGLATGTGVNINIVPWSCEYNGVIYYPYLTDVYTVGFFEVEPTAAITAEILTANAFTPTSPAKLATLPTAILTLDGTGAAGTVGLYLQHHNDVVGRWESYAGVADEWTLIGSYAATTTIDLPTLPAREGEQVRAKFVFASTDGTAPAPAVVTLSLSWTSDVSAPVAPTIASIVGVGGAGAVCDLGPVPATARHITAEVDIDGAGFLPLSKRNKIESGHGSMEFLGASDSDEQAGGRNSVQVLVEGLTLGQVVTVRAKAVDAVGNISAGTDSEALEIEEPGGPVVTPQLYIEDATVFSGQTANIRVHLIGTVTSQVTVDFDTAEGTATDPEDFAGVSTSLTFEADALEHRYQDVEINANGTAPQTGTLAFTCVLSGAVGATIERATGNVVLKALDYVPVMVETAIVRVDRTSETRVEVSR